MLLNQEKKSTVHADKVLYCQMIVQRIIEVIRVIILVDLSSGFQIGA